MSLWKSNSSYYVFPVVFNNDPKLSRLRKFTTDVDIQGGKSVTEEAATAKVLAEILINSYKIKGIKYRNKTKLYHKPDLISLVMEYHNIKKSHLVYPYIKTLKDLLEIRQNKYKEWKFPKKWLQDTLIENISLEEHYLKHRTYGYTILLVERGDFFKHIQDDLPIYNNPEDKALSDDLNNSFMKLLRLADMENLSFFHLFQHITGDKNLYELVR